VVGDAPTGGELRSENPVRGRTPIHTLVGHFLDDPMPLC